MAGRLSDRVALITGSGIGRACAARLAAFGAPDVLVAAGVGSPRPMGRYGWPDEIASAALFPASDESAFVTGEILHPSGGVFVG